MSAPLAAQASKKRQSKAAEAVEAYFQSGARDYTYRPDEASGSPLWDDQIKNSAGGINNGAGDRRERGRQVRRGSSGSGGGECTVDGGVNYPFSPRSLSPPSGDRLSAMASPRAPPSVRQAEGAREHEGPQVRNRPRVPW